MKKKRSCPYHPALPYFVYRTVSEDCHACAWINRDCEGSTHSDGSIHERTTERERSLYARGGRWLSRCIYASDYASVEARARAVSRHRSSLPPPPELLHFPFRRCNGGRVYALCIELTRSLSAQPGRVETNVHFEEERWGWERSLLRAGLPSFAFRSIQRRRMLVWCLLPTSTRYRVRDRGAAQTSLSSVVRTGSERSEHFRGCGTHGSNASACARTFSTIVFLPSVRLEASVAPLVLLVDPSSWYWYQGEGGGDWNKRKTQLGSTHTNISVALAWSK